MSAGKNLFSSLVVEGETLLKRAEFRRAYDALSRALEIEEDASVRILRSQTLVGMGRAEDGVKDSDIALKSDPKNYRATLAKAEALFASGKFEFALIYFHRGKEKRPDIHEFQTGIDKCKKAINDSIVQEEIDVPKEKTVRSPHSQKLSAAAAPFSVGPKEQEENFSIPPLNLDRTRKNDYSASPRRSITARSVASTVNSKNRKEKNLLGELYKDRMFLEELNSDLGLRKNLKGEENGIDKIVDSGLSYLDARREFWRQQKPPESPEKATERRSRTARSWRSLSSRVGISSKSALGSARGSGSKSAPLPPGPPPVTKQRVSSARTEGGQGAAENMKSPKSKRFDASQRMSRKKYIEQTRYAIQTLENINTAIENGELELALKFSKSFLSRLATIDLADKPKILANLYSLMGNTYLELNKLTLAVIHHRKDLDIAIRYDYKDAYLRALENLGITYERMGDFAQALRMWEKKLEFAGPDEVSRLWEDIGRCYYQLGDCETAIAYVERALETAKEQTDKPRQLSAMYTIGHTLCKMDKHDKAIEYFSGYLELARELEDAVAEANALTDLGNAYLQIGDISKSIAYQQQAVALSSKLH